MRRSDAFRLLVESVQNELLYFAVRRCVPMHDAEDLVQRVVISVGNGLAKYNHVVPITDWFYARTRFRIIDYHRRVGSRPEIYSLDTAPTVDGERDNRQPLAPDEDFSPPLLAILKERISWLRAALAGKREPGPAS
jgi:RNA polymerase sigma factor (sigma-70 family)